MRFLRPTDASPEPGTRAEACPTVPCPRCANPMPVASFDQRCPRCQARVAAARACPGGCSGCAMGQGAS